MAGAKSKTNASSRVHDPRPKSELIIECYRKSNGAIGVRSRLEPINRD